MQAYGQAPICPDRVYPSSLCLLCPPAALLTALYAYSGGRISVDQQVEQGVERLKSTVAKSAILAVVGDELAQKSV